MKFSQERNDNFNYVLIKNIDNEKEINIDEYIKLLEEAYKIKKLSLNMNAIIIINIVSHQNVKSGIVSEEIPVNFLDAMEKDQSTNVNLMIIKNFI